MRIINKQSLLLRNKNFLIVLIILVVGLGGYLLLRNSYQTPTQPPQPTLTPTISETNQVVTRDFAFSPAVVKVKVGTTITWTNEDSASHQIGSEPDGGLFKSQSLNKGETYTFTFEKAGEYNYLCLIHPSMKGKVIVE